MATRPALCSVPIMSFYLTPRSNTRYIDILGTQGMSDVLFSTEEDAWEAASAFESHPLSKKYGVRGWLMVKKHVETPTPIKR